LYRPGVRIAVAAVLVVSAFFPLVLLLAPAPARADVVWLPEPRAISRASSASRDTPVLEYAYGPRAQASIGVEAGVVAVGQRDVVTRYSLYAMVALENATETKFFPPNELWRGLIGVSVAVELPRLAGSWLGPGTDLELALVVGHESDHETGNSVVDLGTPLQTTLPFGAGGDFVAPDLAVSLPAGPLRFVVRLVDRIYFNAFPLLAGARTASDAIADDLHEGLANAAGADLIARWRLAPWFQPQLALYAEHLFARDPVVEDGGFFRAMLGAALPGKMGELVPFGSFDAGNGKGLLVERRELRLSFGVRYAVF
jgi:hypothetical protein